MVLTMMLMPMGMMTQLLILNCNQDDDDGDDDKDDDGDDDKYDMKDEKFLSQVAWRPAINLASHHVTFLPFCHHHHL